MADYAGTLNSDAFLRWRAPFFRFGRPGDHLADRAWQVDDSGGPSFVDETTDFGDVGAGDCDPFPATEAVNDYFAIGHRYPFSSLTIDTGTARSGGTLVWEYYDGSAWVSLTVTDGTNTLSTTGAQLVTFDIPEDWTALSLNGAELFYVRLRVTATMTTNPVIDQGFVSDLYSRGHGIPFPRYQNNNNGIKGASLQPPVFVGSGAFSAGTKTGATSSEVVKAGTSSEFGYNAWWFDMIHIRPKPYLSKIEFGTIITQLEDSYEIYNAFRTVTATESAITNNASPGVVLPNNTPPETLPPQSSLLDPTSTDNSGGTGLGTLVELKIQAQADGLPSFDTTIVFQFGAPANDVFLLLSGDRIVLFPIEYEGGDDGPVERLEFNTEIHEAISGREKRPAVRKNPRQFFDVVYNLDGADRQRMRAQIFDWLDNQFGFPVWHEYLRLTAATSPGATQFQVLGADEVDFRVGGLAVVFQDADVFDVINLSAKTNTLLTADSPATNGYAIDTLVMPVRLAYVKGRIPTTRELVELESFKMTWEVVDNDTGVPAASSTPGFWSTYNGRVLFSDCNVLTGNKLPGTFNRKIIRTDNRTGKVTISSPWDRAKASTVKGFNLRSRAEIMELRKLWYALRGQQKAFYLPTFAEDLEVVDTLTTGIATMDIRNIGYTKFAKDRIPWTVFRITYTDDTSEVKVVSSSAVVSATVERLTLTTTWSTTRSAAEVRRVEFYELSRFESDTLRLKYKRIGRAEGRVPVVRVFDDNA